MQTLDQKLMAINLLYYLLYEAFTVLLVVILVQLMRPICLGR